MTPCWEHWEEISLNSLEIWMLSIVTWLCPIRYLLVLLIAHNCSYLKESIFCQVLSYNFCSYGASPAQRFFPWTSAQKRKVPLCSLFLIYFLVDVMFMLMLEKRSPPRIVTLIWCRDLWVPLIQRAVLLGAAAPGRSVGPDHALTDGSQSGTASRNCMDLPFCRPTTYRDKNQCNASWQAKAPNCADSQHHRLVLIICNITFSTSSGTKLLDRGWTQSFSGTAQGNRERGWAAEEVVASGITGKESRT